MRINIRTQYVELGEGLKKLIEKKFSSLEKFLSRFEKKEKKKGKQKELTQIWLEISKVSLRHKKGPYFYTEAQICLPKKVLRAESKSENLELAIDEIKKEIENQIRTYIRKKIAKRERLARKIKREIKVAKEARVKESKRERQESLT